MRSTRLAGVVLSVSFLCFSAASASANCLSLSAERKACAAFLQNPGSQTARTARARTVRPQGLWSQTVLPEIETWMLGWVEYNPASCTGDSGNWAVTTPAVRGTTRTGIEMLELDNGDCVGVLFPFNVMFYTWTDATDGVTSDLFRATWSSLSHSSAETFQLTKAHVNVRGFDLTNGLVDLELVGPSDVVGALKATFSGSPVDAVPQVSQGVYPAGVTSMLIDRTALRRSDYNSLRVNWSVSPTPPTGRLEPVQPWQVLGQVRYSQYNVPDESACTGGTGDYYVVDSLTACNFAPAVLSARFARQVNLNGTGVSASHGTLKSGAATRLGSACAGSFPPGATVDNSFVQVPDVRGSCNAVLVPDVSLAVARGAGIACGRRLQLVQTSNANFGVRARHDLCPACSRDFGGTEGHIDHFSGATACSSNAVGDLGNYWSAQLR